jgi:hypothetical protein
MFSGDSVSTTIGTCAKFWPGFKKQLGSIETVSSIQTPVQGLSAEPDSDFGSSRL